MEAPSLANVLPVIEARFAFLVERFGFALAQSTEVPSSAWFRRDERTIVVAYDFMRAATVEVAFEDASTGTRYQLPDVLAFEKGVELRAADGVRESALVVERARSGREARYNELPEAPDRFGFEAIGAPR